MRATWQPIVEGELARLAARAIDEICEALLAAPATPDGLSLACGGTGAALFLAYAGAARESPQLLDAADELLDRGVDALETTSLPPGLHDGFAGLAWAIEHLDRQGGDEDRNDELDRCLLAHTARSPWRGSDDLIRGLVGLGVYALERVHRPQGRALLAQIVDRLGELAQRPSAGITWFRPADQLNAWKQRLYPAGCHDLGMAHGVPGVIALLAACVEHEVSPSSARALLEGGVAWLLAQRPPSGTFDEVVAPGRLPRATRLAWCYGDPGVAAALLLAGRAAGQPSWQDAAITLMRSAAQRPAERSGVVDAGLCHGAAGLAHMFNRFFQATGIAELRDAARRWIEHVLASRAPGSGIAGFRVHHRDPDRPERVEWRADPGLLEGAAGIGLALLAATTAIEPAWDRVLLLSYRDRVPLRDA